LKIVTLKTSFPGNYKSFPNRQLANSSIKKAQISISF